jgi:15-cis-phytoene synthase
VASSTNERVVSLAQSYAYCEEMAKREAGNFYHAFRILPASERSSMCALYAFLRIADDLSDDADDLGVKRQLLSDWRRRFLDALAGTPTHPLHVALVEAIHKHDIPVEYLLAVLDGVEMDLEPVCYQDFDQLRQYCYRVASAVGLACIHIWGFSGDRATEYAENAGIAFQLTNILRDLGEDANRGRVYLPRDEMLRFGYSEEDLRRRVRDKRFEALMRFQADRAHRYYEESAPLAALLAKPGRAVFQVMARTYRGLLRAMERRRFDVFSRRVSLSSWHKVWLVLSALPTRWGWNFRS